MNEQVDTALKNKIALYGNLATSGGSVVLLVVALQTVEPTAGGAAAS